MDIMNSIFIIDIKCRKNIIRIYNQKNNKNNKKYIHIVKKYYKNYNIISLLK